MSFDQANTQAINADTTNANITNEETTMTETTVTETVTETQAKATKPITTAKYARHLLTLQEARVKRLEDELAEARVRVNELDELAATLPETATTTAANVKRYAVFEGVSFRFGRAEKARTLEGSIVAVKIEDGKAVQYRVAVGEGFDQKLFTVFPGQIIPSANEASNEAPTESANEAAI